MLSQINFFKIIFYFANPMNMNTFSIINLNNIFFPIFIFLQRSSSEKKLKKISLNKPIFKKSIVFRNIHEPSAFSTHTSPSTCKIVFFSPFSEVNHLRKIICCFDHMTLQLLKNNLYF